MAEAGYLGEAIRQAREVVGMSQAELARRIGISKNAMNDIETGDADPRASRIRAIALALDVSSDFLLGLAVAYQRMNRTQEAIQRVSARVGITLPTPQPPAKRPRTRKAASVG